MRCIGIIFVIIAIYFCAESQAQFGIGGGFQIGLGGPQIGFGNSQFGRGFNGFGGRGRGFNDFGGRGRGFNDFGGRGRGFNDFGGHGRGFNDFRGGRGRGRGNGNGFCERFCTLDYNPVCGSFRNGRLQEFGNACTFSIAQCQFPGLRFYRRGRCYF